MGLHDVETMNEIRKAVNKVDPTIIIYGEPWWAAQPQLPHHKQAVTANMYQMTQVASFNDRSREAFKNTALVRQTERFLLVLNTHLQAQAKN